MQGRTLKLEQGGSYLSLAGPKAREAGPVGGSGGMPPQENVGLRHSEIASSVALSGPLYECGRFVRTPRTPSAYGPVMYRLR